MPSGRPHHYERVTKCPPPWNLFTRLIRLKVCAKERNMTPKRILVPLDGKADAEAVLPVVAPGASAIGATVRLLHVAPLPHNLVSESGRVVMYSDQEMERLNAQWLAYLAGVRATLHDTAIECAVRFGDPVEESVAETEAWGAELIAMTTARPPRFGWRGRRRIGETVSRKAGVPVVLYQTR
jgi:nucleotide-binding universal stress UspA family protein